MLLQNKYQDRTAIHIGPRQK